ncbi:MAG: bifunctional riboflavin kinase/FAD synthetase [Polyangiales bacterium]
MQIVHDHRVARRTRPTALAIGNFDGVHRGHKHLLGMVREAAGRLGGDAVALTFEPHPTRVLAPERARPILTGLDRKLELLAAEGLDAAVVLRFDQGFAAQSPEEFVSSVIASLDAREVFVGEDFRFGHARAGDGAALIRLGEVYGFTARVVAQVADAGGETVSSSRVRERLAEGDLAGARRMLDRDFDLDGVVIPGQRRGRTLGFPTANLATPCEALPKDGVYAVRARVLGGDDRDHPAVMNLGVRPTVAAGRSVEVHLLDGDHDLYGRTLRVTFVARIRDERRFDGLDALVAQIRRDADEARDILKGQQPP